VDISNPNTIEIAVHTIAVMRTWRNPAMIDFFPISFMSDGFSSIPTIKSRSAIPILAND
jgi:hypothetical protein